MPELSFDPRLAAMLMTSPRPLTERAGPEEAPLLRTLMGQAQGGDQSAYAALLKECLPIIRRLARQNGIDPGLVDDVVQDTLMTVHRARHTYDPTRPFMPWLRAIVQRRGIDLRRKRGRQASRELHVPLAYEAHPDPDGGAELALERQGRAGRLAAAVAQLPPGQREALEQLGMKERSLADVSAATGRSVVSLKVNLHRAIKSLRQIMGPE